MEQNNESNLSHGSVKSHLNSTQEILRDMLSHSLNANDLICDGRIHRFNVDSHDTKKSGYYAVYENRKNGSGELFYGYMYGNFKTGERFTGSTLKGAMSHEEEKLFKKQIEDANRKGKAERKKIQDEAAIECQAKWASLKTEGESQYLAKKQIDNKKWDIRYDERSTIYVSVRNEKGQLRSLQRIDWTGQKFFHPGGEIQSNYFTIEGDGNAIYIVEGFATGCSIHLAMCAKVIVAFNAENLAAVARKIRQLNPNKQFVICGDDDRFGDKNVGREKAEEAAKACLGHAVFPEFQNDDGKPTDFNDLHVNEGLDEVKRQLRELDRQEPLAVTALGFRDSTYFFTSTRNRQFVSVTSFTESDFLKLAPLEYWEAVFPAGGAKFDKSLATSTLIDQCHGLGIFDNCRIRGSGVWEDAGRIVVNMGDHLMVDGISVELGRFNSKYFYSLSRPLQPLHLNPLSISECELLSKIANKFCWAKQDSAILLLGALVLARVCGALPVRPHIWITGAAQTGKTTLLDRFVKPLLGNHAFNIQSNSTEAGIRQNLGVDARPVIFDELETNGGKGDALIPAVIELFRAAWSDTSALIVKGSANGTPSYYIPRFSGIVASIRVSLNNEADKGRFCELELKPHGSDGKRWQELSVLLSQITEDYAARLFARAIKLMPVLLENFRILKPILAEKVSARFGDQYGMLLAGFGILISDEPLSNTEAKSLAILLDTNDKSEDANVTDHYDCIQHLATSVIRDDTRTISIVEVVREARDRHRFDVLKRNGLSLKGEYLFVATDSHSELRKIFSGTKWQIDWTRTLRRLEGAKSEKASLFGKDQRGTLIPLRHIFESDKKSDDASGER